MIIITKHTEEKELTMEDLKKALNFHKHELKMIKLMNEAQYRAFRSNFSVGYAEPSRIRAIAVLESMIGLNLRMQQDLKEGKKG